MFAHGFRPNRTEKGIDKYVSKRSKSQNQIETWNKQVDKIVQEMWDWLNQHLPNITNEILLKAKSVNAPTIAETGVGNFMITKNNFASTIHIDKDYGYAFGIWYDIGIEIDGGEFVFPQYQCSIPLTHGTGLIWNAAKIHHGTARTRTTNNAQRIGSSIQLNTSLLKRSEFQNKEIS